MAKAKSAAVKQLQTAARALGDGTLIDKILALDWEKIIATLTTLFAGCAPVAAPGKLRGLMRNPDARSEKILEREVKREYIEQHSRRDWNKDKDEVMEFAKAQGKDKAMQDRLLAGAQALVDSGEVGEE